MGNLVGCFPGENLLPSAGIVFYDSSLFVCYAVDKNRGNKSTLIGKSGIRGSKLQEADF